MGTRDVILISWLPMAVACSAGSAQTASGAEDAGTSNTTCMVQPENVRVQLCDTARNNALYACDEGKAPPAINCTKTVQTNAYCCPLADRTEEAGTVSTAPTSGLYHGACLLQFAFGEPQSAVHFRVTTTAAPEARLAMTLQSLATDAVSVSSNYVVGQPVASAAVVSDRKFLAELGTLVIPGAANPISGREIRIANAKLEGTFSSDGFCGHLRGDVREPPLGPLDPSINICQFRRIEDGGQKTSFAASDFQTAACPL